MSVGLKIEWVTKVPTLKGHKRNTCVMKSFEFGTIEEAEIFAKMSSDLIDELVRQMTKPKTSIIVPGVASA